MKGRITYIPIFFTDEGGLIFRYTPPTHQDIEHFQACLYADNGIIAYTSWRDIPLDSDTYTFTLTDSEKNVIYNYMLTTDVLTVKLKLLTQTIISYEEDVATTTLILENAEPTFTPTVKDTNAATVALTGNNQRFIRYFSNAQYSIGAKANKGAEHIKTQSIKCGSTTLYTPTGTINGVTSNTFYLAATDSRGLTGRDFMTRDLIPYVRLTCGNVKIDEFNGHGDLTFTIEGKYFNGSFGKENNSMQLQYMITDENGQLYEERIDSSGNPTGEMIPFNDDGESSGWVELGEITPTTGLNNTYTYSRTLTGLDYMTSYEITISVNDALTPVQERKTVAAASPIFDWSNEDFNFNIPVKASKNIIVPNTKTDLTSAKIGGGVYSQKSNGTYVDLISMYENNISINGTNEADYVEIGENVAIGKDSIMMDASSITIGADTLNINGYPLADYVIEQGTDNLYYYRKWNSGKLEAWRSTQNTVYITTNKQDGALYYTNDLKLTISGISAFKAVESVQLTINKNGGVGLFMPVLINYGISSGVVTINYLVVNSSNSSANIIPNVHIIGRWK